MNWTPDRMLSRLDGDTELAAQLAAIFIDEYPRMLERLRVEPWRPDRPTRFAVPRTR